MEKDFQQQVFEVIRSMTGEANIMAVPKVFLSITNDLETGIFLSQLVYLSDKGKRDDGYIYKTIDEWKQDLFMSEYSIRKAKKALEDMGLIETKVMKADGNPTVHYKVNKEKLVKTILRIQSLETSNSKKPNDENEVSITKTTTETTTEDIKENIKEKSEPQSNSNIFTEFPLEDGTTYPVSEEMISELESVYTKIDVHQKIKEMRAWLLANPQKQKTRRGTPKFINGWLLRENDKSSAQKTKSAGDFLC